jgi:AbrB family looped-hinge helix DNA binding protein
LGRVALDSSSRRAVDGDLGYKEGQTNIPAAIRKRHRIQEGDRLVWLDDGEVIRIVPVPKDPLKALRGAGEGEGLLDRLLRSRREENR